MQEEAENVFNPSIESSSCPLLEEFEALETVLTYVQASNDVSASCAVGNRTLIYNLNCEVDVKRDVENLVGK